MLIPFATQSYKAASGAISSERALNMFAEREPEDSKTPVALLQSPGIVTFATIPGVDTVRQMRGMGDLLYVVASNFLYSVNSTGAVTMIGSLGPSTSGSVQMSDNTKQIFILNNGTGWVYRLQVIAVLAADALAGATTLVLTFDNQISSMKLGDAIEVQLDNGQTFTTHLATDAAPGAILGFTNPMPSPASTGNLITDAASGSTSTLTIVNNVPTGSFTAFVDSIDGLAIGDAIDIALDNGGTHSTTILSLTPGPTISLAAGLPSQASAGLAVHDTTPRLDQVTDVNFEPADTVTAYDDYFVFNVTGKNQFRMSSLNNGETFPYFYFGTTFVNPGPCLAALADHEWLLLFCEKGIETWYDSGAAQFPFARYDGATIERGCGAAQTVVKDDNGVFFFGNDKVYYRLQGPLPVRVSTPGVETEWSKYPTTSDAFSFSYTFAGHKNVVVTFPSAPGGGATWVFDISSGLWHERDSIDSNMNSLGRWRASCCWSIFDKVFIGDSRSGQIGYLSQDTFTEFGSIMRGQAVGPAVRKDRKRVFMPAFEIEMEAGVGLAVTTPPVLYLNDALPSAASAGNQLVDMTTDPDVPGFNTTLAAAAAGGAKQISVASIERIGIGDTIMLWLDDHTPFQTTVHFVADPANPKVYLDFSNDGGKTWSTPQLPRSMGKDGEYLTRLRWLRLGQSRQRFLRITTVDPVRRNIVGAYADTYLGM